MEQGFSCSTLALQNTDILEGIRKKKTDVICNSLPLGCGLSKHIVMSGVYNNIFSTNRHERKRVADYIWVFFTNPF